MLRFKSNGFFIGKKFLKKRFSIRLNAYIYKINLIQMKKYLLVITIPVVFFASCKKNNNNDNVTIPVVDTSLLVSQELTYDSNNALTQTRTFKYDSQNRMILQYTNRPGSYASGANYTYNSSGNLVTAIIKDTTYTNSTITATTSTTWEFSYTNNVPVSATESGGLSPDNYTFTVVGNQITELYDNNVLYAQYSYSGNNLTSEVDYFGTSTVTYTGTYNVGKGAFYLSGNKWNFPEDLIPLGGQNQQTTYGISNAYTNIYSVTSFNAAYPAVISESSSLTNTTSTIKYKYIVPKS